LQSVIERQVREVARKEKEDEVCSRSLMAFNVNMWQGENKEDVSLEEKVTEDIYKMSNHRVTVLEVVAFKPQDGRPMAARITLGSAQQKRTLFRAIADNIKKRTRYGHQVRPISFRDCFSADKTLEAKKLAAKGMAIKRQGRIQAFRVVSQGPACIPQTRTNRGQKWSVHIEEEDNRASREDDTEDGMGERRTAANRVVLAAARDNVEVRDSKTAKMVVQEVIEKKVEDIAKSAGLEKFRFKKAEIK